MRGLTVYRRGKAAVFVAAFCRAFIVFGVFSFPISSAASQRLISVISGTYGQNCGAHPGNATRDLTSKCNGRETCDYVLDTEIAVDVGDYCSKDFRAEWQCNSGESHIAVLSPKAGRGSTLVLTCIEPTGAGR